MLVEASTIMKVLALAVFLAGVAGGLSVSLLNEITVKDRRDREREKRIKKIEKNKYKPINKLL